MNRCLQPSVKPLVESDADLEPNSYSLQKFTVYETQARFYLVGRDTTRTRWRVLKIDRSEPTQLNIYEDPAVYTRQDCNDLINRLTEGNRSSGGVNFVTKAYGIVGFIKFLEPYYMILVTKRRLVGNICGHAIYGIGERRLLTIPHSSVLTNLTFSKAESRYKRLFCSIDLTKDFFYSYTYRIMWSLQKNVHIGDSERMPYDDMFVWNAFLTLEVRNQVKSLHWTVALVHGFFRQVKLSCGNAKFTLTLIARRSRHFAGTRYLKRGVNGKGRVANDVETEQVVHEELFGTVGQISSVVQHRGSIPLLWSQETSILSPKPDIILHKHDSTYEATTLHFQNLAARYGNPVIVLNLVKTVEKRPRETILCREFANAVAYLNHNLPKTDRIKFIQWDFHMFARSKSANVLEVLDSIAVDVLDLIGFYYSGKESQDDFGTNRNNASNELENSSQVQVVANNEQAGKRMLQHGILRSNCIDCLDRTNVAQYAFGLAALGQQMHALGLCRTPRLEGDSGLAVTLMDMYENMGDVLAIQYGGSAAHNKVFSERQGKWKAAIQSLEFFRSIKRHYHNAYLDGEKQDAINIFLGHFRPEIGKLALWQLDSDHHLQIRRAGDDPMNDLRLSFKRSLSTGNMRDQNGDSTMLPEVVSRMDHNLMKLLCVNKPSIASNGMPKRVQTISEAEMRKSIVNEDYEGLSDARPEEANPFVLHNTYSSAYKSADVRGLGDCAEVDWLSSSGNSCEEDAQERLSVTIMENDNWHGSGLLPGTINDPENYESKEYFYDLTVALLKADPAKDWKSSRTVKRESSEDMDTCNLQEEQDVGSDVIRIRAGADSFGVFSKSFVDWIQEGQTLCH